MRGEKIFAAVGMLVMMSGVVFAEDITSPVFHSNTEKYKVTESRESDRPLRQCRADGHGASGSEHHHPHGDRLAGG